MIIWRDTYITFAKGYGGTVWCAKLQSVTCYFIYIRKRLGCFSILEKLIGAVVELELSSGAIKLEIIESHSM